AQVSGAALVADAVAHSHGVAVGLQPGDLRLEAAQSGLTVTVVLVEDRDARHAQFGDGVAGHQRSFDLVVGEGGVDQSVRLLCEGFRTRGRADPRNARPLDEGEGSQSVGRAHPAYEGEDFLLVDELTNSSHRARRVVTIVTCLQYQFAAVDAAVVVDVAEVGVDGRRDGAPSRSWTRLGRPRTDDDLSVGNAVLSETDCAEGGDDDADKKLPHVAPLPGAGYLSI